MSMNLQAKANPSKGVSYLAGNNEPSSKHYSLYFDVFKVELNAAFSKIRIGIKFGS